MALVVPKRFRRRLIAAFVLVAGVTAGILALGSYLAVRQYRHDAFADQAREQVSLLALAAPRQLSLEGFEALLKLLAPATHRPDPRCCRDRAMSPPKREL